ncbi:hypothetical protein ATANTOWER_022183 [Ataeniobius toweri]|uniref:Ig-like domain-containing protein n=1 Tax=Ataeniobius toweri TaxID=208326 RepID=A0ABU7AIK2_9TELE|nr:hypothetical protein [Ataeniobius toweri]
MSHRGKSCQCLAVDQSEMMKLLLSCWLLLCARLSWSVSSDTLVTQSPDVSFHEGQTGNISCCWKGKAERVGIKWLKNRTLVENKIVINQSTTSQNEQANSCSVQIFPDFAIRDSGRYICKWVTGELVPISSSLWARGRVHPGQVASPSQGNIYSYSYSLSSAYPGPGRGGSRLSTDAQMSLSPDTSSSSSGWSPRRSQASRET